MNLLTANPVWRKFHRSGPMFHLVDGIRLTAGSPCVEMQATLTAIANPWFRMLRHYARQSSAERQGIVRVRRPRRTQRLTRDVMLSVDEDLGGSLEGVAVVSSQYGAPAGGLTADGKALRPSRGYVKPGS